jgi:hypothetical protein
MTFCQNQNSENSKILRILIQTENSKFLFILISRLKFLFKKRQPRKDNQILKYLKIHGSVLISCF